MKNQKKKLSLGILSITSLACAVLALSRCGSGDSTVSYTQIERLGRPAINEGLVLTNAKLQLYNSLAPTADLADAAAGIRTEITTVLGLIRTFSGANSLSGISNAAVVAGFLPDVMRINTAVASGYNADTGTTTDGHAMLTGGRKITDDVMNITLNYLFNSSAVATDSAATDTVTYAAGHTAAGTTFPYLAAPRILTR